jgi:hypothetical protein
LLRILHNIIKMGIKEMRQNRVDWIHLAQYANQWAALANTVINLFVP